MQDSVRNGVCTCGYCRWHRARVELRRVRVELRRVRVKAALLLLATAAAFAVYVAAWIVLAEHIAKHFLW